MALSSLRSEESLPWTKKSAIGSKPLLVTSRAPLMHLISKRPQADEM